MKTEVLSRLFALDDVYTKLGQFDIYKINEFRDRIAEQSIDEIEDNILKLSNNNAGFVLAWYLQYKNHCCKMIEIDPTKCVLDEPHRLTGTLPFTKGESLFAINFLRDPSGGNDEASKKRLMSETRITRMGGSFQRLLKEIPPVVRDIGGKYEVCMGNHRIMSAIRHNVDKIKVLVFCDHKDPYVIENFADIWNPKTSLWKWIKSLFYKLL